MMRISQIVLFILGSVSAIFLSAEPEKSLNKIKRAEGSLTVHDEVMPKIGQLKKLEKEAEKKIEMPLKMGWNCKIHFKSRN